ncbi:MAG TPA: VWA domain-containing protein [Hyphomicrobiales bacterium]|nr:VWA domain-containing protein [Kaistiaceae bacterium]HQF30705.1 VWA domain-containing protein [Hyphomicrobiales bacterium]
MGGINFWEPEEAIGALWHRFVERLDEIPRYPDAAVALEDMQSRIAILFHGLGGDAGLEIVASAVTGSKHRLSFRRRLGHVAEREVRPSLDAERFSLPSIIDVFPETGLNEKLYLWLAAWAAHADAPPALPRDPLKADIVTLRHVRAVDARTLAACPGLRRIEAELKAAALALRPVFRMPGDEMAVEAAVRHFLGDPAELSASARAIVATVDDRAAALDAFKAKIDYKPFRPLVFWPDHRPTVAGAGRRPGGDEPEAGSGAAEGGQDRRRAKRREGDQANRPDSLILNRFETILSWAEFLNINRKVEDEDADTAKRVSEDMDEIGVTDHDKKAATKLAFDLDMAPEDVSREKLSGECLYPEWDYRAAAYHQDHCRVLASEAEEAAETPAFLADPETRRRIRAVKRRFEALKPKRVALPRQPDGDDLDMEALVRSLVDLKATGEGSDRVYRAIRQEARDLAVAILVDTSRSTESVVEERAVIDVAKESLIALAHGLTAVGDDYAIYAFSSLRRHRVFVARCKSFEEALGSKVEARIAALKPGFYTRLGAAVRHVAAELQQRPSQRRLLLVLTDGKPNDLDHYEGRYGVEDTRRAVNEARRLGQAVFGVTIDKQARDYVSHVFGRNGHAIVSRPSRLMQALPLLYQQLVA